MKWGFRSGGVPASGARGLHSKWSADFQSGRLQFGALKGSARYRVGGCGSAGYRRGVMTVGESGLGGLYDQHARAADDGRQAKLSGSLGLASYIAHTHACRHARKHAHIHT